MSFLGGFAKALAMVGVSDEALQQENAELRRQVDDWRKQYEGLHRAYDELNGRHQALSKSNSETLAWHSGLRDRVQKLENENSRLRDQACVLEGDNNELREQVEDLRKKNGDVEKRLSELQVENVELQECTKELRKENFNLNRANRDLSWESQALVRRLEIYEQATAGQEEGEFRPEDLAEAKKKADLLDLNLQSGIGISVKTLNALIRSDINTVGEVCQHSALELLELRNFGLGRLNDLNYQLGLMGLKLADEKDAKAQRRANKALSVSRAQLMKIEELELSDEAYNVAKEAGWEVASDIVDRIRVDWPWSVNLWTVKRIVQDDDRATEIANELRCKMQAKGFPVK